MGGATATVPGRRPRGVTVVAVLDLVGGVLLALLTPLLLAIPERSVQIMEALGVRRGDLFVAFAVIAGLGIGAGVGLLRGRTWGWWLGTLACAYTVARHLNALFALAVWVGTGAFANTELSPASLVVRNVGPIVWSTIIYFYLFRPHVRTHFGVAHVSPGWIVYMQVGLCVLFFLIWTIVTSVR